jgi:mono/diheme cytochrome c family protein
MLAPAMAGGATAIMAQEAPGQPQSVWSGIYSEAQAYRGEKVADTACLGCHGARLAGGDSGPKLVGGNFLADWDGKSAGDLFDYISRMMPENAPGTLKDEEVASAIAYMLQQNGMPSGRQDLAPDREALGRITILAMQPSP